MLATFRYTVLILLELLAALVATLLVLAALLVWRLGEGPLRLEGLTPYLVDGLSELALPYQVRVAQTSLTLGSERDTLGLQARDVRIITPEGLLMATLPMVEIDLSLPALLLGRPAPQAIRLIGPQVRVLRTPEGRIQLTLSNSEQDSDSAGTTDLLPRWLDALGAAPSAGSLLGPLRRVEILQAKMAVDDHQYKVRWLAPRANLTFARDELGIRGGLDLAVALGDTPAELKGDLRYQRAQGVWQARLALSKLNPANLAKLGPAFAVFADFNMPLQGQLDLRYLAPLGLTRASFDLVASKGTLPGFAGKPLQLAYGRLAGVIDRQQRRAEISNLYLDFDGPKITASLQAQRNTGDEVAIAAEGSISQMPAAELANYWPTAVAPGARHWVSENITAGRVPSVHLQTHLTLPLANPARLKLQDLRGQLAFTGLTTHYLRPMPPVTNIDGRAQFTADEFRIEIAKGSLGELVVAPATIRLLGLQSGSERADIDLTVRGTLADQLTLLDHDRLGYPRRLGIQAQTAQGQAVTRARLLFPLWGHLPMEMVAIAATAKLTQAGLPDVVATADLRKADLQVIVDGAGMRLEGTGEVGGAPATFSWTESFLSDVSPSTEITFTGTADEAARRAFQVSWPEVIAGISAVNGRYEKDSGRPATLTLALDLKDTILALPWFDWHKLAGKPAEGSATLVFAEGQVKEVSAFSLSGSGAEVTGKVSFAAKSRWQQVDLAKLTTLDTSLRGSITNRGVQGLALNLKGNSVNLTGVFGQAKPATPVPVSADAAAPVTALQPLDIIFDFRKIQTGPQTTLTAAKGHLIRSERGWRKLDVTGKLGGQTPASIKLVPSTTGRYLDIESQDAGALLRTLGLMENIKGGSIRVMGKGDGLGPVTAIIDLRNFTYLNARTLQKLARAAAPEGADKLAQAEGIFFKRLRADFTYNEDHLQVKNGRMSGDLLGLTLAGRVDLLASRLDLAGTLVPLYGLNSVVGGIPILGWLLTGGEGGGVFAATYSVKGKLRDPETSVNPLAMLAPGFLRELFFVDKNPGQR